MALSRLSVVASIILFALTVISASAQTEAKEPRILILLDGSSSMLQPWDDSNSRFQMAGKIIMQLMDSVYALNSDVEFGLRVYGHQSPAQDNNCYDTKQEVMFSRDNRTQMSLRLESLRPAGVSPIAFSLKQTAEMDLINTAKYSYSIVLITDGGESCSGNICAVAEELLKKKIAFKPYIISLVDYTPLRQQYSCLGEYLLAAHEREIPVTIGTIIKEYGKIIPVKTFVKSVPINVVIPIGKSKLNSSKMALLQLSNTSHPCTSTIRHPHFKKIPIADYRDPVSPGYGYIYVVKISDINGLSLFFEENDKFIRLNRLNINGLLEGQKLRILAGRYKISYKNKTTNVWTHQEFVIKNDMITELELKQ